VQVSNDNGVEFYCKVAPPSGEFRWIHKDDISREQPTAESVRRRAPAGDDEDEPVDERDVRTDHWGSWVKSRRTDAHHAGGTAVESNPLRSGEKTGRSIALAAAAEEGRDDSRVARQRRTARRGDEAALAAELRSIDRELSRIVVEEPGQWDFAKVRERVESAMADATNEEIRDQFLDLQERIERFDDIRKRSLAINGSADELKNTGESHHVAESRHVDESAAADSSARLRHGESSIGETRPREREYDGVGKLTRVVSQRPGAPRYALVNSANEVVAFVSPGSGVNLQSFEGQHVGISGQRGYMPELKKAHVTALRVNALGGGQARLARRR
jgi:hypothetical protein